MECDIFTQFIEIKNSQDEQKQDLHRNGRFALIGSILIVSIVNARINCDSTLKLYYLGSINPFSRQVMDKITGTQITNEILSKISSFWHVDIQPIDYLLYCHFCVYLTISRHWTYQGKVQSQFWTCDIKTMDTRNYLNDH